MVAPDEREFTTFVRGQARDDVVLDNFRNGLRVLVNPATGLAFTEDEIQRATQPGSRFYIDADSLDLLTMSQQKRSLFLADQVDPRRANTNFLESQHGRIWLGKDSKLPATGASGTVLGKGTPGTIFVGNATLGDPTAVVGTDPNGLRYQVLADVTMPASGEASVPIKGLNTGFVTNQVPGIVITWSENVPPSAEPQAAVEEQVAKPGVGLDGGFDKETDEEYAIRIEERIANRPASGNATHFQAWAQQASSAVEQAFVYPAGLNAGSVVLAPTQKRNQNQTDGPNARLPNAALIIELTNFLTPPNSPVVPQRVFMLVTPIVAQEADLIVRLAMSQGSGGGWADSEPWPNPPVPLDPSTTEAVQVTAVTSPTVFDIATTILLPGGVSPLSGSDAPEIMVWVKATSRFEKLQVASIAHTGVLATVTLAVAPTHTIVAGDRISPFTDRLAVIAEASEDYFDSLGPGQIVPPADPRASRAARQPLTSVKFPTRAGQAIVSALVDALGGVAPDVELVNITRNEPDLPGAITDGPNMITFGNFNAYPL